MSQPLQKTVFLHYLLSDNREGSGKATSYVRALELLEEMLKIRAFGFGDCVAIWSVHSLERLEALRILVSDQTRQWETSPWNRKEFPKSYLRDGYCRAALRAYQEFLLENAHERELRQILDDPKTKKDEMGKILNRPVRVPDFLVEDYAPQEGKTVRRSVETRVNQNIFRRIILEIYQDRCCLTALDIPAINRASHILSWSAYPKSRMDPSNGLCLSATYDAAFDRHLISLDEDYRLILSKDLKDHYTGESVQKWFHQREGAKIALPSRFPPSQNFLKLHRESGRF